ncbi:Protein CHLORORESPIRATORY REDUCTION 42 [Ranunculus cassubicifolius]
MALSFSTVTLPSSKLSTNSVFNPRNTSTFIKCESSNSSDRNSELKIGSAIIVVDAPKTIKTAASVPCLRVNTDLVKPGDVGRIVARKPKDVWAVRLAIGTYLMDGKYFKPLDLDEL